ncbi:hypothetical protein NH340_JMT07376 [Sarcoptes scabiei]|nr:hypothetical protein NH340_JMT07376 [Sarcoptes scabiei]
MKFLYSLAPNSFKNIGNFLKSFPNKIYSVEIKIKSRSNDQASSSNTKIDLDEDITLEHKQTIFDQISRQPILKQHNDLSSSTINTQQEKKSDLSQQQIIDNVNGIAKSLEKFGNKTSLSSLISLNLILKQLVQLLQRYPEVSSYAIRQRIHSKLLRIRDKTDSFYNLVNAEKGNATKNPQMNYKKILNENSRQILSMFGHADQPKGRGIRVLSIDGGGTKGLTSIEILRQIEQQHGKPIHEIFDLICGVSTGAIIAMLLGALRISIDECESYYRQVSSYLFKTDILRGTSRLLWTHAYYDTAIFEKVLKETYGERVMIHSKRDKDCPYIVVISAIVNMPTLEPYLFRNYDLHPSSKPLSYFQGGSSHKIWEAVRASSAAPGFFEEFTLNKHVHQDGGILINNPTAVAVHEAKLLWPKEEIQCVVSLGSGRHIPPHLNKYPDDCIESDVSLSSLKHKITRLIDSATDTEMIHRLMQDMMPNDVYYRFNPTLTDPSSIDENRSEKLQQLSYDAQMYLRKNGHKFSKALEQLSLKRRRKQICMDYLNHKYQIYF